MRYPLLWPALLLSFFLPGIVRAQTGSVWLQDGTGTTLSTHASITQAYAAIPATLTQAYTLVVDTGYNGAQEVFPIRFVAKAGADALNRIHVVKGPNATFRTVLVDNDSTALFLLDGADYIHIGQSMSGVAGGLILGSTTETRRAPLVELVNGASHNLLAGLTLGPPEYDTLPVPLILFGRSDGEPGGNSHNTIRQCQALGASSYIWLKGSPDHPNTGNVIRNCGFTGRDMIVAGSGTGVLEIADNYLHLEAGNAGRLSAIVLDSLRDSVHIAGNTFHLGVFAPMNDAVAGVDVRETGGSGQRLLLSNNYFSFADTATVPLVAGVRLQASPALHAGIYFNTFRMLSPSLNGAAAGSTGSAALYIEAPGPGSSCDIRNNIFCNNNTGADTSVLHTGLHLSDPAGLVFADYNTYNTLSGGRLAVANGVAYSDMGLYIASFSNGSEQHGNDSTVRFAAVSGYLLHGSMLNHPGLQGGTGTGIFLDKQGEFRNWPYRGADEFTVTCTQSPFPGAFAGTTGGNLGCPHPTPLSIVYVPAAPVSGRFYQWQSRPAGSTAAFVNVPGADDLVLHTTVTQPVEFRMKDSCMSGAAPVYTYTSPYVFEPFAHADSVVATYQGNGSYSFQAAGAQHIVVYNWDFGDGSPTTNAATPLHQYNSIGSYTVRLIYRNDCHRDTLYLPLQVSEASGVNVVPVPQFRVYPNPASEVVNIRSLGNREIRGLRLYNAMGAEVPLPFRRQGQGYELMVAGLPQGMYVLRVETPEGPAALSLSIRY